MAALALVGCVWTPYSPTAMSGSEKFLAPCLRHLFGTDNFGDGDGYPVMKSYTIGLTLTF